MSDKEMIDIKKTFLIVHSIYMVYYLLSVVCTLKMLWGGVLVLKCVRVHFISIMC